MIPTHIPKNETHVFFMNDSRGLHVGFFRMDAKRQKPVARHWLQECHDQRSRLALVRWLCIRRNQWQEWGQLAESIGHDAFADHLDVLMAAEPIEVVLNGVIQQDAATCTIAIGEVLAGTVGVKTDILYQHRFKSIKAFDRFLTWLTTGNNCDRVMGLASMAYNCGTVLLGVELDRLARSFKREKGEVAG